MNQRLGYTKAILKLVDQMDILDNVSIRVYGDTNSTVFPESLIPYTKLNIDNGVPSCRVNILVNYNYKWDISGDPYHTASLPEIDLVVRWGGRTRLSGFLPIQCAYADICVLQPLWPDAMPMDLDNAIAWYSEQDVTKGG
jgi:undecaprenyl diphosphate synthase